MKNSRNDRFDTDRREMKLIRVGHYLWSLYKNERGKSEPLNQEQALYAALEIVWSLKKQLREELVVERAAKAAITARRFRERKVNYFSLTEGVIDPWPVAVQ